MSSLGWCASQQKGCISAEGVHFSMLMRGALVQETMGALCCTVSLLCWLYLCAVVHVLQVP